MIPGSGNQGSTRLNLEKQCADKPEQICGNRKAAPAAADNSGMAGDRGTLLCIGTVAPIIDCEEVERAR